MTHRMQDIASLLKQIRAIVGAEHASDDPLQCDLATSDVFSRNPQAPALMVVHPKSTVETSAVVRLLSEHGVPVVARGAGLSYTGSFAINSPAAVVDMSRMNDVQPNVADRYAVVGAGASWAHVADALKPLGMAATQISPISGAFATVGGLASQGIPAGTDGFLGVTVVLADGSVVQTGAPAHFHRFAGPDVTGLFLGDCGAFGIKTEVVLRIAPEQPASFASFGFPRRRRTLAEPDDLHERQGRHTRLRHGSRQICRCHKGQYRRSGQDGSGRNPAIGDNCSVGQGRCEAVASRDEWSR